MKPYGSTALRPCIFGDISSPDVADIHAYGLKSAAGRLRGKGGDIRSSFKNKGAKSAARRRLARLARRAGKADCEAE